MRIVPLSLLLCLPVPTSSSLEAREIPALSDTAKPKAGVPEGKVESFRWTESKVYPGTERDGSLYLPAQYKAEQPANCVIFLDGSGYLNKGGGARATIVLDNMIAAGELPVTCAVFINPGNIAASKLAGAKAPSSRAISGPVDVSQATDN